MPGIPAYSVKVHAKFPGQDPAIHGVLVLHDLTTGAVIALMESGHLTALRTGLAGALGADALARRDARTVAIIGAGAQGRSQLAALRLVRPITAVNVLDTAAAARSFARDPVCDGLAVRVVDSLDEALDSADVVITSTWAREPFLFKRHLQPGVRRGRSSPDDITVFGSVGLAFQDLAAGWRAYTLARERGVGRSVRLLD